jgi:hypothetical protein
MTREELINKIMSLGLAKSFLETFTTEELNTAFNSFDGPYKYLTGLDSAREKDLM